MMVDMFYLGYGFYFRNISRYFLRVLVRREFVYDNVFINNDDFRVNMFVYLNLNLFIIVMFY